MTKHTRLIVSVLFIVVIILAIAITRFNSKNDKGSLNGTMQPAVAKKLGTDDSGNRIFQDTNGLYGILDNKRYRFLVIDIEIVIENIVH